MTKKKYYGMRRYVCNCVIKYGLEYKSIDPKMAKYFYKTLNIPDTDTDLPYKFKYNSMLTVYKREIEWYKKLNGGN